MQNDFSVSPYIQTAPNSLTTATLYYVVIKYMRFFQM